MKQHLTKQHTEPVDPSNSLQQTTCNTQYPRTDRSLHAELWIIVGWVLISVKCAALWWAIITYKVPIHPLWLVIPTVAFGMLATALYIWRD